MKLEIGTDNFNEYLAASDVIDYDNQISKLWLKAYLKLLIRKLISEDCI
jgi:hypothetical protein